MDIGAQRGDERGRKVFDQSNNRLFSAFKGKKFIAEVGAFNRIEDVIEAITRSSKELDVLNIFFSKAANISISPNNLHQIVASRQTAKLLSLLVKVAIQSGIWRESPAVVAYLNPTKFKQFSYN